MAGTGRPTDKRNVTRDDSVPPVIFVDADACPVKAEMFKVAGRYGLRSVVVANQFQQMPQSRGIELVVVQGFGAVDDHIAETGVERRHVRRPLGIQPPTRLTL
jgi:hypothetical protein